VQEVGLAQWLLEAGVQLIVKSRSEAGKALFSAGFFGASAKRTDTPHQHNGTSGGRIGLVSLTTSSADTIIQPGC
jgi:hypothetical protein